MHSRIRHADGAGRVPPIDRIDLLRTPRGRARESRAPSAGGRVDALGQTPPLRTTDRLFWILLAKAWREWRTALIVVRPDTVVRVHRQWLRRRGAWRSPRTRP